MSRLSHKHKILLSLSTVLVLHFVLNIRVNVCVNSVLVNSVN